VSSYTPLVREGDRATAGGETRRSHRRVEKSFLAPPGTPVQGQRGLEGLCQWPMFRDEIINDTRSDQIDVTPLPKPTPTPPPTHPPTPSHDGHLSTTAAFHFS